MIRAVVQVILFVLPWNLRRILLSRLLGFTVSPKSKIGFSLILADHLEIDEGAKIGNLTVVRGLHRLRIDSYGSLGNLNWVTATPIGSPYFSEQIGREPNLHIQAHAAITHRHIVDCTDSVTIGAYSTFAGWRSQILTHSIDLSRGRQSCAPVAIGMYCFVGTSVVILKGSVLPDRSVLGAGSVLNGKMTEPGMLYGGVPARPVCALDTDGAYFKRLVGYVQ